MKSHRQIPRTGLAHKSTVAAHDDCPQCLSALPPEQAGSSLAGPCAPSSPQSPSFPAAPSIPHLPAKVRTNSPELLYFADNHFSFNLPLLRTHFPQHLCYKIRSSNRVSAYLWLLSYPMSPKVHPTILGPHGRTNPLRRSLCYHPRPHLPP